MLGDDMEFWMMAPPADGLLVRFTTRWARTLSLWTLQPRPCKRADWVARRRLRSGVLLRPARGGGFVPTAMVATAADFGGSVSSSNMTVELNAQPSTRPN